MARRCDKTKRDAPKILCPLVCLNKPAPSPSLSPITICCCCCMHCSSAVEGKKENSREREKEGKQKRLQSVVENPSVRPESLMIPALAHVL